MAKKVVIQNRKVQWYLLFFLLLTFSNSGYPQEEPAPTKIRINPDAARGGTVSQYINTVKFITFENSPQSMFGNIDQLEVTDQYYIILDNTDTHSILIFNRQGKFHAKIESRKINPQNPNIYSFSFEKETKLIKVNFYFNIYFFDLDGKIVMHKKNTANQYFGPEVSLGAGMSGNYLYAPSRPHPKEDSVDYELKTTADGRLLKKYLPYLLNIKFDDSRGSQSHMDFWPDACTADSVAYYTRDYDYDIYKLTPYTFHAAYRFTFPLQLSLPPNFREDTLFNNKRQMFIKKNNQIIFKVVNFFKKTDNLFFKVLSTNFSNFSYIYNMRSQNLICIDKIISDTSSYFLPVTDAEIGGLDFINHGIIHFDGENFYTSYSSLVLFKQMEATKNRHPQYPSSLLAYFNDKKNLKGNPVLVQLKFKSEL
jgi:hypothetical protein